MKWMNVASLVLHVAATIMFAVCAVNSINTTTIILWIASTAFYAMCVGMDISSLIIGD